MRMCDRCGSEKDVSNYDAVGTEYDLCAECVVEFMEFMKFWVNAKVEGQPVSRFETLRNSFSRMDGYRKIGHRSRKALYSIGMVQGRLVSLSENELLGKLERIPGIGPKTIAEVMVFVDQNRSKII